MPPYRCPLCAQPLDDSETAFDCANGHHFDRAREGYVNLLRSGRLKGRDHGDNDEMIRARRAVFAAGLYAPLIDAVATSVAGTQPTSVLDVGCGEGSYLRAATDRAGCGGWGVDISKAAVRLAAKQPSGHTLRYAVASAADLPFFDASFDVVVDVFAHAGSTRRNVSSRPTVSRSSHRPDRTTFARSRPRSMTGRERMTRRCIPARPSRPSTSRWTSRCRDPTFGGTC